MGYIVKEINNRFIINEGQVVESGKVKEYWCTTIEEAEHLKAKLATTFPFMMFTIKKVTGDSHGY